MLGEFPNVVKAAIQKIVFKPTVHVPGEHIADLRDLEKWLGLPFCFFPSNASYFGKKSNSSLSDSVIGNAPDGVLPVNDDTFELVRRKFAEKQLVHSFQVIPETDQTSTSTRLTPRFFCLIITNQH